MLGSATESMNFINQQVSTSKRDNSANARLRENTLEKAQSAISSQLKVQQEMANAIATVKEKGAQAFKGVDIYV